jgi:hypothetical protein
VRSILSLLEAERALMISRDDRLEKQLHKEEKKEEKVVQHAMKDAQKQAKQEKAALKVRSIRFLSRNLR